MMSTHGGTEAEPLLLEGYAGLKDNVQVAAHTKEATIKKIISLYDTWDKAAPDTGRSTQAAGWRANLAEWQASTQPAASP
mgnify:CR=1 FL=1